MVDFVLDDLCGETAEGLLLFFEFYIKNHGKARGKSALTIFVIMISYRKSRFSYPLDVVLNQ